MRKLLFITLALAALLSGCAGQEMSNVTLIQTLGVDGAGPVTLTAVGDQAEAPALYRTQGADVAQAREGFGALGETRLETTHVAQLVLGRSCDVYQTLWQEIVHRESGYGATVWLCREDLAEELLAAAKNPAVRLRSLEENGGVKAPTILEALSALSRTGQVNLPLLVVEDGELWITGYQTVEVE